MSEYLDKLKKRRENKKLIYANPHVSKMIDHIEHLEEIKTTLTKQAMEQQLENEELKDALKRLGESDTNPISGIEGVDLVGLPFLLKEIKAMREYANKVLQGKE